MGTAFYGIALNADIALHRGKVIRSAIVQDAEQQSRRRKRGRVMSFGSRLDEAITMRGITQRKFAKMVGTSEVSISRYISGERNPKMPTAIKMADILNVSLDWLAIDESERKVGKKADVIEAYQKGWNDAIDTMQNAKFVSVADRKTEPQTDIGTSDTVYSDTAGYVPRADMTDCAWMEVK